MGIKVDKRVSHFSSLKKYCHHAGEDDFIEITEWSNGEGYDFVVESAGRRERFSLTHGEWTLLQVLVNYVE